MEITIDTPTLPALPPLPAGIEIPDTAEELFPDQPVTVVLYGKKKQPLWGTSREEEIARQEIFMPVPGKGVCEFQGPLPPIHSVKAVFRGKEFPMTCDRPLPLHRLYRGGRWRLTVHLQG